MLLQGYLLVSLKDGMLLHSKAYAAHFGLVPEAGSSRDCMNLASFLYAIYMSARAIAEGAAAADFQPIKSYEMEFIRLQFHAAAGKILCVVFSSVQLLPAIGAALAKQTCAAFTEYVNDNAQQQHTQQPQSCGSKRFKHILRTVYTNFAIAEGRECCKLLQCQYVRALQLSDIHSLLMLEPGSPRLEIVRPAEPAAASQQQQQQRAGGAQKGWWWRRRAVKHAAASMQHQSGAAELAAPAVASVCVCAVAAEHCDAQLQLLPLPLLQSISKQFPQSLSSSEQSCCSSVYHSVRLDTGQSEQLVWACDIGGIIVLYQAAAIAARSVGTSLQVQQELSAEQAAAVTAFAQASDISLSHPVASSLHSNSSSSGSAKQS
jgi:hypothetical protein